MQQTDVQPIINEIVNQLCFTQVKPEQSLISSQLLDSIGVVDLIVKLEEKFGIRFDLQHVSESRFNTVEQITHEVVQKLNSPEA